jgi:hypothetical protein
MGGVQNPSTEWLEFIFGAIKIAAVLIGGLIAFYEYRRFRRYGAKAQLDLDFDLYPLEEPKRGYLLVILPVIKNLGNIRQIFPVIHTWVNTSSPNDFKDFTPDSEKLISQRNIVKEVPDGYYFVDPGVQQIFSYKAVIEEPGDFVEVIVRFYYRVSWPNYVILRMLARTGWSRRWQDKKKINRLKTFRVDEFHYASKIKQVKGPDKK